MRIFISYRRDDAAGYARAVGDELARRFGAASVFMDVDDIDPGQRFADAIRRAVGEAQVLLVLIGRRWRGAGDGTAPARIDEAGDFVRLEVAAGLASGARVIPLLLDGAPMPAETELPDELRALAGRNALSIDHARFAADLDRLEAALREGDHGDAERSIPRRVAVVATVLAVAAIVGLGVAMWRPAGTVAATAPPVAAASAVPTRTARAAVDGEWEAQVTYDWPNAHHLERFTFGGEAGELHGSASFLGVRRGIVEGSVDADGLRFATRTQESGGPDQLHRYRGHLVAGEWRFVMQTEGGSSPHEPVEFVARRPAAAPR